MNIVIAGGTGFLGQPLARRARRATATTSSS